MYIHVVVLYSKYMLENHVAQVVLRLDHLCVSVLSRKLVRLYPERSYCAQHVGVTVSGLVGGRLCGSLERRKFLRVKLAFFTANRRNVM